jgi:hypothetical protein
MKITKSENCKNESLSQQVIKLEKLLKEANATNERLQLHVSHLWGIIEHVKGIFTGQKSWHEILMLDVKNAREYIENSLRASHFPFTPSA